MNWNLDTLKAQLKQRPEVLDWIVTHEHTRRRERYFMLDGTHLIVDQDRDVHAETVQARIFVKLPKEGRQGEVTQKFFRAQPLAPQLEQAIRAAEQTDYQAWKLPARAAGDVEAGQSSDPRISEDIHRVMEDLTREIGLQVKVARNTEFNSAELFISVHDREYHWGNGLVHRFAQSRIYLEAAYSFSRREADGSIRSDEYLGTSWGVSLEDIQVAKLFGQVSDRAEHSLDVVKPESGTYPVIVDSEVLANLFNESVSQLTATNAYNGLPFIKPGSDFISGASGDLITMSLDPALPYGADTSALSETGIPQKPLKIVEENRVTASLTDQQYAEYLATSPTTVRGNLVVEPGRLSHGELTQSAPKVVEILQFSGLFVDPNSGTFSSEIRLARLYDRDRKTVTYLKGGSLSGSIQKNFRQIRLSRERVKHSTFSSNSFHGHGYFGPEFALLNDVSVVG